MALLTPSLLLLGLLALTQAGLYDNSREYFSKYGGPSESSESSGESKESQEQRIPSYYAKDVIHGLGPDHSILTIDFPKPDFHRVPFAPPQPDIKKHLQQSYEHQNQKPFSAKYESKNRHYEQPRYDSHQEQYDRIFGKPYNPEEKARSKVSVVRTPDGKKIMTMTKPGYKMVVEEMEGKANDSHPNMKMVGRTVEETNSSKVKGDNGETMQHSQSYQYQVVKSESSVDDKPRQANQQRHEFQQPDIHQQFGKANFPSNFPAPVAGFIPEQFQYQHQQKPANFKDPFVFETAHGFRDGHRGF